MTTAPARILETRVSQQGNKERKTTEKNAWYGLIMGAAPRPQNRLRSHEKVLVFFEGTPNPFPWGLQEKRQALRETSRSRRTEKFLTSLNSFEAKRMSPAPNLVNEPKQINR